MNDCLNAVWKRSHCAPISMVDLRADSWVLMCITSIPSQRLAPAVWMNDCTSPILVPKTLNAAAKSEFLGAGRWVL